ncbi:tRNA 2-thiocytidine(32) synthetase TtcA [Flavobacteriales bacterium]|nr:tRNA 2-thiocytidine(32) synthetase TtcA [Flavobacteriales bacterium]
MIQLQVMDIENRIKISSKKLRKKVWQANEQFGLIKEGDKIMVCLSGGKDSYTLLDLLSTMQNAPHINFSIIAVHLNQKQPNYPDHILPAYLDELQVDYQIIEKDTYSIVLDKIDIGKTMCSLCSRLRRGTLYQAASELGATKIALGHHRDDILETFFLNLFFNGKIETMPPKFKTDNGKHIVIRPLAYCKESDIEAYSALKEFPIIPCNLCGSQDGLQRQLAKKMLHEWEEKFPGRLESVFTSFKNIHPSHMLDTTLYDFQKISAFTS